MDLGTIFLSETVGTAMLILLGCGVVANIALAKTKGNAGGFLMVNFGWGLAVFAGVTVAYSSGAHLNPAVTLGLWASGVELSFTQILVYFAGEFVGAFIGAVLVWLAYKQHFDDEPLAANKLGVFSTGPAIRSSAWNLITEIIGTFVLVFVIVGFGRVGDVDLSVPAGLAALGALPVALLVVVIGISLGGPTGYAINPARDLSPRIAHAVLPIAGKGTSDWGYAWIPVVGPVIGGILGGLAAAPLLPLS
ncbi:glycerol uptake facilitator protein [Glaciihabitans tibetensis]|uniref:Glycerol uptake facilitator protein n=1 Tax=Glaciihabitans tibetensis TaxID=1266600 RepID=A0A2T0VE90_9MICO|nr:MIP/aquaporin family protein [Glaciihabitans tibetensis]PRY68499.1 glycerol uptake facilitator protein [Glaciihabitans tibetensis]